MSKFSTLLLVLVFAFSSVFSGCEKDEKKEEPPPVSVSLEGGAQAGTQGGEEAGQQAGEEAQQAGEEAQGGEAASAGEEAPLDQGVGDAGEMAGDQDVSGGETSQVEDCEESAEEDGCVEPESEVVCEEDSLAEGEECDDNVEPSSDSEDSAE